MEHLLAAQLEEGLDHVRAAPRDSGTVEMLVTRPDEGEREVLEQGELTHDDGLVGDNWRVRHAEGETADPEAQLTVMNARYADLISGGRDRWPLAGDQIYVDLDLSMDHLPPGSRLRIGTAVIEISAQPHTGCAKFNARFGRDALRLANSPVGRDLRLRGANAKVVKPGIIRAGDAVEKL